MKISFSTKFCIESGTVFSLPSITEKEYKFIAYEYVFEICDNVVDGNSIFLILVIYVYF